MKRFFCIAFIISTFIIPAVPTNLHATGEISIILLGDYLPAASAAPVIRRKGYSYTFSGVRDALQETDIIFLNLETPLSGGGTAHENKQYVFHADPEAAEAMRSAGVRVVSLANNHIMDYGPDALDDTLKSLRSAGIAHVGAGRTLSEASMPAAFRIRNMNTAFLAFSNTFPKDFWAKKGSPGTFFGSDWAVKRAVKAAAGTGPLIVSFHWGEELARQPKEYQIYLAHLAIDSGADLVVGHHPHVPQPIEIYRGKPILYSLGNFSFGSYSSNATEGLMVKAFIGLDEICTKLEVYPLLVDNEKVAFKPRLLSGPEGRAVFDSIAGDIPESAARVAWEDDRGIIEPKKLND